MRISVVAETLRDPLAEFWRLCDGAEGWWSGAEAPFELEPDVDASLMLREDVDAPRRGCARGWSVDEVAFAGREARPSESDEKRPCFGWSDDIISTSVPRDKLMKHFQKLMQTVFKPDLAQA